MDFYLTAILQGFCFSGIVLGIFISMKIFNIPDITTDGSYTLGAVVTAIVLMRHISTFIALPIVIFAGALSGALTGFIHTKLKINALLAGILVMYSLYSINLTLMGRSNLPLINVSSLFTVLNLNANGNLNSLFILFTFVVIIVLIIGFLLKTDFGIAMRATGDSETMIRSLGVNTDRMKIIGLALANSLTAVSGYMISQYQGFTDINMGIGIVIVGLGSVIIAETFINFFNITSVWLSLGLVILGAVIFQLVLAITLDLGVDANLLKLVTATFVLVVIIIPRLKFNSLTKF
jgi:putative ABC transport system permease protein